MTRVMHPTSSEPEGTDPDQSKAAAQAPRRRRAPLIAWMTAAVFLTCCVALNVISYMNEQSLDPFDPDIEYLNDGDRIVIFLECRSSDCSVEGNRYRLKPKAAKVFNPSLKHPRPNYLKLFDDNDILIGCVALRKHDVVIDFVAFVSEVADCDTIQTRIANAT